MADISQFREHYSTLHLDELIHIALTRELVPEAQEALTAELAVRGITDLSSYRKQMTRELDAENLNRDIQLARRAKVSSWSNKIAYVFGFLCFLYGVFLINFPDPTGQDDTLLVIIGPAIISFVWVRGKINKFWAEQILFRKPPQ